ERRISSSRLTGSVSLANGSINERVGGERDASGSESEAGNFTKFALVFWLRALVEARCPCSNSGKVREPGSGRVGNEKNDVVAGVARFARLRNTGHRDGTVQAGLLDRTGWGRRCLEERNRPVLARRVLDSRDGDRGVRSRSGAEACSPASANSGRASAQARARPGEACRSAQTEGAARDVDRALRLQQGGAERPRKDAARQ